MQVDWSQDQQQPPQTQPLFSQQPSQSCGAGPGTALSQRTTYAGAGSATVPSVFPASATAAAAPSRQMSTPVLPHLPLDIAAAAERSGRGGRAPAPRVDAGQRYSSYSRLL